MSSYFWVKPSWWPLSAGSRKAEGIGGDCDLFDGSEHRSVARGRPARGEDAPGEMTRLTRLVAYKSFQQDLMGQVQGQRDIDEGSKRGLHLPTPRPARAGQQTASFWLKLKVALPAPASSYKGFRGRSYKPILT